MRKTKKNTTGASIKNSSYKGEKIQFKLNIFSSRFKVQGSRSGALQLWTTHANLSPEKFIHIFMMCSINATTSVLNQQTAVDFSNQKKTLLHNINIIRDIINY